MKEVLPYRSERRRILDDTHGGVVYDSSTTRERALRKSRLLLSFFLFSSGAEPAAEINVGTFVLFRALGVPSASQHSKIVFSFLDARHVTGGHARRQRLPVLVHSNESRKVAGFSRHPHQLPCNLTLKLHVSDIVRWFLVGAGRTRTPAPPGPGIGKTRGADAVAELISKRDTYIRHRVNKIEILRVLLLIHTSD